MAPEITDPSPSFHWPLPDQRPQDFRLLVVDDQELVRVALLRMLRRQGYVCLEVGGAPQALELLERERVDLILCDVLMPGMNGLELVRALGHRIPTTAVLMVSGMDSADMAMDCLSEGAFGYVLKPVQPNAIIVAVAGALRRRMLELDYRDRESLLARKVREQTEEIRQSREEIAIRLLSASEHRDNETGAHVRRIGRYSSELARLLGWEPEAVDCILAAAPMHDLGKIGVPDRILQKEGPLSEEEWILMRTHTTMGENMLKDSTVPFIQMGSRIAACHHEKWNGTGYPHRYSGEAIPLEARIVALVDVYDALSSRRPYKQAWTEDRVLSLIHEQSGQHFDPTLAALFLEHYPRFKAILTSTPDTYPEPDLP